MGNPERTVTATTRKNSTPASAWRNIGTAIQPTIPLKPSRSKRAATNCTIVLN